jgi:voltage-gated potassium channel
MNHEPSSVQPHHDHLGLFQVLVLVLSVFALVSVMAQTFLRLPPQVDLLLTRLDTLVCMVFLADFAQGYALAKDKGRFMRWGWIDLVSSIPALEVLRWGRLVRIIRLLRVLRAFRSVRLLIGHLYSKRERAAISTALCAALLIVIFSSIAVVTFESDTGSNLSSAGDGLWWSLYTMANMDYMGRFPVSFEGKLIRLLLVVTGMVLLGTFTGWAASFFIEDEEREQSEGLSELRLEIAKLREELKR